MTSYIADLIAQSLISLEFITKAAGVVQEIQVPLKGGKTLRIPAAPTVYTSGDRPECGTGADYYTLVPDTAETGIAYCEDLGATVTESNGIRQTLEGSIKLVCWLNMKKIGYPNTITDLASAVFGAVPRAVAAGSSVLGGSLRLASQYSRNSNPFERYDYDEAQTQHLILPYNYFSLKLTYKIYIPTNCQIEITLNPESC